MTNFNGMQTKTVEVLRHYWPSPRKHPFGVLAEARSGRACLYVYIGEDGSISRVMIEHIFTGTQYTFDIRQIADNVSLPRETPAIDVLRDFSPANAIEMLRSTP